MFYFIFFNIIYSNYASNESNMDEDSHSLALSAEDKYDDGGSFIGEYGGERPPKKYEEMFVWSPYKTQRSWI